MLKFAMSKEISYGDHHTHAQDICFNNQESAKNFGIKVGDHLYPSVEIQKYVDHVLKDNLDTIWLIYEDVTQLGLIREAILAKRPECQVNGFYFIRDPLAVDENIFKYLYELGFIQGIKIHPVIDNYPLKPEYLDKIMNMARQHNLPVIFHSDDRAKTMHLTSPEYQHEMAVTYPSVRLVIGHGGAYANPRLVGENNTAARSYWKNREELVTAALNLATNYPNVFYELSITTNSIKATIIKEYIENNPKIIPKILSGSDYPCLSARLISQINSLEKANLNKFVVSEIAKNRL